MYGDELELPPGAKLVQPPALELPPGAKLVQADSSDDPRFQLGGGLVTDSTAIDRLPDARSVPLYNSNGVIKPVQDQPLSGIEKTILAPLEYLKGGMEQLGQGLSGVAHPKSVDQFLGATSDVIRGGMTTATPFVLPEMLAAPKAAALGLGTFGAVQQGTEFTARKLGLPEGTTHLVGDLVGMYGGSRVYRWMSQLAQLPDKEIANGIYKRLEAAVESLKDPALSADEKAATKASIDAMMHSLRLEEGVGLVPKLFPNPNPSERSAYDYMRNTVGVAPDAGAATGSPFVRGGRWLSAMTPGGAVMDVAAKKQTTAALRDHATQLLAGAMPTEGPSKDYYTEFERHVNQTPAVNVPLKIANDGSQIEGDVRVPVDIRDLKYELQPLYDKMQFMPMADRNSSSAYSALKAFLESPDFITAPSAEWGLSNFKKAARTEAGGVAEMVAKRIIPQLQAVIDGAVEGHAGADAMTALQKGRAAAAKEAGAEWLTDQFQKARQEGGFGHEKVLWNQWSALKQTAKRTMFNPQQVAELDKFFLGLKMLSENPNPSGTALAGAIMAQAGYAAHGGVVDPTFWLGQLSAAGVAKLLRSDVGVRLLTEGLRVPRTSGRAKYIQQRLQRILGNDGGAPPAQGPPAGGPGGPTPPGGPSARQRIGEFLSSEEGSSPRRKQVDPIAQVSLRFLMDQPLIDGGAKTVDVAKELRKTARSNGGSLSPGEKPEVRMARAVAAMHDDLDFALASQPAARDWYTGSVAEMEKQIVANRSEFQDPGKMSLFKYLLGVTSNGVDPETNFDAAMRGWDLYKQHGRFMAYDPGRVSEFSNSGDVGLTFRANSYKTAMTRLDKLVQEKGEAGAAEWLRTKHPIAELKQYNPDVSVNDRSDRYGSYVLGEKVGAFGANLNGIYSELTADKWWSRTWNRWMGTTIATDGEGRFKTNKETGDPLTQDDPRNEGERNLMRMAASKVAGTLNLTVAELQAVLWYAEQALYRAHGLEASSADYSMAATKFFAKKGSSAGPAPGPASGPSPQSSGSPPAPRP